MVESKNKISEKCLQQALLQFQALFDKFLKKRHERRASEC